VVGFQLKAFRDGMIKMLPRAPNNLASLESLRAMPMRRVILERDDIRFIHILRL
jgi:hypothetical protein